MVSGPHSSKMALGRLFNISRENSSGIFEMLLPKSYCREYADIDPTSKFIFLNSIFFSKFNFLKCF